MPVNQIAVPPVGLYIAGRSGTNFQLLDCSIGSGSAGLPQGRIINEPAARRSGRSSLQNMRLAAAPQDEVEVVIAGDGGSRVIWLGDIVAQQGAIDSGGDSITYIARVEPHHFGIPLSTFW